MAIQPKTAKEIKLLREGGKHLAHVLAVLKDATVVGVSTAELEDKARGEIEKLGDTPAFLDYRPDGARRGYPAATCISINDEIVHGVPNEHEKIVKEGDLVTLDLGLIHEGLITDSAITVGVGNITDDAQKLLKATREALRAGIDAAQYGNHVGDIGAAIEEVAKRYGVTIYRELVGHGVGYAVHEDPYVPNFGTQGHGDELVENMVIAIEPMFGLGSERIKLASDGYTYCTADGSLSAHFEHTIVITQDGPRVLTTE